MFPAKMFIAHEHLKIAQGDFLAAGSSHFPVIYMLVLDIFSVAVWNCLRYCKLEEIN